MEIVVKGRNIEVTDKLRRYAEEKIGRITRYFSPIYAIEVELTSEKNPSVPNSETVEVTVDTKGPLLRAKVSSDDMYGSIDRVVDKLERQIKRYKEKLYTSMKSNSAAARPAAETAAEAATEPHVVKTKRIELKPMTPEEAALQMDLLGHDFFLFSNSETEAVNLVYKRQDGDYGLIEPITGKG